MPTHFYPVQILEKMLDFNAHVHHAQYLLIYEEARWDFCHARGYGLAKVLEEKKGPIILNFNINFFKELTLRQHILVQTEIFNIKKRVFSMRQKMVHPHQPEMVFSDVEFVMALFDQNTRRVILPTPLWLAAMGVETTST